MHRIVFDVVEEIAGANVGLHPQVLLLEIRKAGQGSSIALAQINEYESEIFYRRTTADPNLLGKSFFLRRLLDTLPGAVEFPAVKTAADAIPLYQTDGKRRLAVRSTKVDDLRSAAFAAIQGKIFAHDPNWLGPARF